MRAEQARIRKAIDDKRLLRGCEPSKANKFLGLTAEEADLLAPPVLADYAPWVVPLTVRPNGEYPTDTADD